MSETNGTDARRPLNLVLFADGTGNEGGTTPDSNVFRLYKAIDIHGEAVEQRTFYDVGVGTSHLAPYKAISGAVGVGFAHNVRDLYRFLARNYDPDRETKIWVFGFSRGAATARAFTGFVERRGLIDGRDLPLRELDERVHHEFERYLSRVQRAVDVSAPGYHTGAIPIHFIGVWDTVAALGAPQWGEPSLLNPLSFAFREVCRGLNWAGNKLFRYGAYDYGLNPHITHAYHALAIDDERTSFRPEVWDEKAGAYAAGDPNRTVEQVWFAGMHSNVGGGYARAELAMIALEWMVDHAIEHGLVLNELDLEAIRERSNPFGLMEDSRSGTGILFRYQPRDVAGLCGDRIGANGEGLPRIHESVLQRMEARTDDYAPQLLPRRFHVVTTRPGRDGKRPDPRIVVVPTEEQTWDRLRRKLARGVHRRKALWSVMLATLLVGVGWATALWSAMITPPTSWGRAGLFGHIADVLDYFLPDLFGGLIQYTVVERPRIFLVVVLIATIGWTNRSLTIRSSRDRRARLREILIAHRLAESAGPEEVKS